MADQYHVITPEAVPLSFDLAGVGTRFLAAFLDLLIVIGLFIVIGLMTIGLSALEGGFGDVAAVFFFTGTFVIFWGYYIVFEAWWGGQSPGKRACGARVVRTDGLPIGFMESLIRNLVRLVDFLPSFYGVGVIVMFVGTKPRRLGDYAAGTIVVKERGRINLQNVSLESGISLAESVKFGGENVWSVEALSLDDAHQIRQFLSRPAPRFRRRRRRRQLRRLANGIAQRVGAESVNLDPENFLRRVLALYDSPSAGKRFTGSDSGSPEQAWDTRALGPVEAHMVDEFLGRAPTLEPKARRRLADTLARRISAEIGAGDSQEDPEEFLHRVAVLRSSSSEQDDQ